MPTSTYIESKILTHTCNPELKKEENCHKVLTPKSKGLTAGDNITIINNVISAVDNYVDTATFDNDTRNLILGRTGTLPDLRVNIPGSSYTLPIASSSLLGGIKVGANLTINPTTGILSAIVQTHIHNIANASGATQFSFAANDSLRFEGAGGTSISFDSATKKIIITSVSTGGDGDGNNYSTSHTFVNGLLSTTRFGLPNISVNLDGRYLQANQSIIWTADSGSDVTGTATGTTSLVPSVILKNVNSNIGTFNTLTVNAKGLVTAATNVSYLTSLVHNHGIADSTGTQQFTFGIGDNIRFEGTGGTTISFNSSTKKVTINSTSSEDNYVDSLIFNNSSRLLTLGRTGILSDLTATIPDKYVSAAAFTGTNTKTLTLTFNDTSTISASFTDMVGDVGEGDGNDYTISGIFNILTGDLTYTRTDGGTYTVNLDGRYLTSYTDNYVDAVSFDNSSRILTLGRTGLLSDLTTTIGDKYVTALAVTGTNTKTITLTFNDSSTVSGSFTDMIGSVGSSDGNDFTTAAHFNTSSGLLSFDRTDTTNAYSVNLDGRYVTSIAHVHGIANAAGAEQFTFAIGEDVRIEGTGATTVSFTPVSKKVTINTTETDPIALAKTVTLTAGTGIAITGIATQALSTNPSWTINATNSGTVTSVAATISGALAVSGSPITSTGTLAFAWQGTTSQYVRGDGSLATFPSIPSGTVTSVGLSMPTGFSVANSPITSSGTLTVSTTLNGVIIGNGTGFSTATIGAGLTYSSSTLSWNGVTGRKNTGTDIGTRRRLNFIEGANVTVDVVDSGTDLDITIASTASGGGGGTVTTFSAGNLSPLFTTNVTTATTTPNLTFALSNVAAHTFFGNFTGSSDVPSFGSPLLASADFANQGTTTTVLHGNASGNPSWGQVVTADIATANVTYAKIQNVTSQTLLGRYDVANGVTQEITIGSGLTLNSSTGVLSATPSAITGQALTKTDDTNVTLTLGGTPSSALLAAVSLTLGWTGTLSTTRGGTGLSTYAAGDLLTYVSGSTLAKIAIGTANQLLRVNSTATSAEWFTPSYLTSLSHTHGIDNSAGTQQFTFGVGEDIRFEGTGLTTVTFTPATKKITINSSFTETDPIALAKTITINAGTGISIAQTATQALSTNPSWTIVNTITQYTDTMARAAISATAPIHYVNTTGVISHDTSGVTAGTYNNVTVDTFGHVTAASNVSYLQSLAHTHGIANSAGTQQFTFAVGDNIRFEGTGATSVAFDAATKKVTFSSTNSGGTVTSVASTSADLNITGSPITTSGTLDYTLKTVNANVGTFGDATHVAQITANGKGLTTAVANVLITPAASSITNGQALTKVDDTNVTLTLGGTPSTSLLSATSLTLGWTGVLSVTRGGTGQSTYTDGQLLIGNSVGNTLTKSTLTAGTGISITNGNGSITISSTGLTAITANNGLTANTSTNVQLGGTLLHDTTIDATSNYGLLITGNHNFYTFKSISTDHTAIHAVSTGGISIYTESVSNTALTAVSSTASAAVAQSDSWIGLFASSNSYLAGQFYVVPTSTNTVHNAVSIVRDVSGGVGANGIGVSMDFQPAASDGNHYTSTEFVSKWTTANLTTRLSQFIITGVDRSTSTSTVDLFTLSGNGALRLNKYGAGSFTGTAVKNLLVDSNGNVIEGAVPLTSYTDTNNYPTAVSLGTTGIVTISRNGLSDISTSAASGTWGINITGNSATVTNGVYTTGSYANPSWITSLSYSKITGGTSSQFVKADGSLDGSTYLTSYSETDTLNSVTSRGSTTTNSFGTSGTFTAGRINLDNTNVHIVGISTSDYLDFKDVSNNTIFRVANSGDISIPAGYLRISNGGSANLASFQWKQENDNPHLRLYRPTGGSPDSSIWDIFIDSFGTLNFGFTSKNRYSEASTDFTTRVAFGNAGTLNIPALGGINTRFAGVTSSGDLTTLNTSTIDVTFNSLSVSGSGGIAVGSGDGSAFISGTVSNSYISLSQYSGAKWSVGSNVGIYDAATDRNLYFNYYTGSAWTNCAWVNTGGAVYAAAFYESSDIRFKTVIEENPQIDANFNLLKFTKHGKEEQIRFGYSAQEIQKTIPEAVEEVNGRLEVNYTDVFAVQIYNLQQEIKKLKDELERLNK